MAPSGSDNLFAKDTHKGPVDGTAILRPYTPASGTVNGARRPRFSVGESWEDAHQPRVRLAALLLEMVAHLLDQPPQATARVPSVWILRNVGRYVLENP